MAGANSNRIETRTSQAHRRIVGYGGVYIALLTTLLSVLGVLSWLRTITDSERLLLAVGLATTFPMLGLVFRSYQKLVTRKGRWILDSANTVTQDS